jgi:hypothetical protein
MEECENLAVEINSLDSKIRDAFVPRGPKERIIYHWPAEFHTDEGIAVAGHLLATQERILFVRLHGGFFGSGKAEFMVDLDWANLTNVDAPKRGYDRKLLYVDSKREYIFSHKEADAIAALSDHLRWARQGYATAFLEEHGFETDLVTSCIEPMRAGQFDTAVRNAYILLETKIRHTILADPDTVGVDLVEKAFHPESGMLNFGRTPAEKQGVYFLFRGAIQAIRNPITHDLTQGYSKDEAFRMIAFVDVLLKMMNEGLDLKRKGRLR